MPFQDLNSAGDRAVRRRVRQVCRQGRPQGLFIGKNEAVSLVMVWELPAEFRLN